MTLGWRRHIETLCRWLPQSFHLKESGHKSTCIFREKGGYFLKRVKRPAYTGFHGWNVYPIPRTEGDTRSGRTHKKPNDLRTCESEEPAWVGEGWGIFHWIFPFFCWFVCLLRESSFYTINTLEKESCRKSRTNILPISRTVSTGFF